MNKPATILLERQCAPMGLRDKHQEILATLEGVPHETLMQNSTLLYWFGLALLSESRFTEGRTILDLLEHRLPPEPSKLDAGRLQILKALESVYQGDSMAALNHARQATMLLPSTALQEHFRAWATREVLARYLGEFEESDTAFEELTILYQQLPADQHWWFKFIVPNFADWLLKSGRMHESEALLRAQLDISPSELSEILILRLARIAFEQEDIEQAESWLAMAAEYRESKHSSPSYWSVEEVLIHAQILRYKGDLDDALKLLSDAVRQRYHMGSPAEIQGPQLLLADIWIEQNQYALAELWLRLYSRGFQAWPRSFGQTMPKLVEANLLVAQNRGTEALGILQTLVEHGKELRHSGMLVQIHAKRAYAYARMGNESAAISAANDAIEAGKFGNYALSYLANGVDVRDFLTRNVAATLAKQKLKRSEPPKLSIREIEILELVEAGFSNSEIADQLYIARNTVKNHLANIYLRLGISSRQEAVRIAKASGWLERNSDMVE